MQRRKFIGEAARVAGAGLMAAGALSKKGYAGNDEIVMAVVGINGQGKSHFRCFNDIPGVRIKTICEVDERLYPAAAKFAAGLGAEKSALSMISAVCWRIRTLTPCQSLHPSSGMP